MHYSALGVTALLASASDHNIWRYDTFDEQTSALSRLIKRRNHVREAIAMLIRIQPDPFLTPQFFPVCKTIQPNATFQPSRKSSASAPSPRIPTTNNM